MTQADTQEIAVIIACYNAQDTIQRAIQSALRQNSVHEVIIVDDCSTDNSVKNAKSADDGTGRLKIITQDKNQGPSAARNKAIDNCTSDWIAILDSDDFLLPERMEKLLEHADQYDIIADDLYQTDEENLTPPFPTLLQPALQIARTISLAEFVQSNVSKGKRTRGELGFIKPLIRKSLFDQHNIRYQEHMRLGEDYEIYTRLLAHEAKMNLIPATGYVSIRRWNSLSGIHGTQDLKHLRDCNTKILSDFDLSNEERQALQNHFKSMDCRYSWRAFIDAVKTKDINAMIVHFFRPYPVPFFITGQITLHFYNKIFGKLRSE